MPTTIPYDPALVLGNIVTDEFFNALDQIAKAQSPMDGAQDSMNDLITLRRSMDMTVEELVQLGLGDEAMKPLRDEITKLNKQIGDAAGDYITSCTTGLATVQTAKKGLRAIHHGPESPIDYNRTQTKKMPLSADSMRMNVQYFSYDSNTQSSDSHAATVAGFVAESTSFLGDSYSMQAAASAARQTSSQTSSHNLDGTLVIAVTCTHKDAVLLAPFILDPDKAARVWNQLHPDDAIKTGDPSGISIDAGKDDGATPKNDMKVISGATYGSSFVGMVHVLKQENTSASQAMESVAASMQAQFAVSCWFADESGGFGADSSMSDDIKNLLSTQSISSHVSLVTMGVIPSIKSNTVQIGVKQFADFDPAKMMEKLATLANATSGDKKSVALAASAARTGGQMVALEGATIQNVMSSLADIDDGQNKMLDINSLMTALDDYVDKAIAGDIGVPVNYYVKAITKIDIEQAWVGKYFPDQHFITISVDDSHTGPNPAPPTPAPAG